MGYGPHSPVLNLTLNASDNVYISLVLFRVFLCLCLSPDENLRYISLIFVTMTLTFKILSELYLGNYKITGS